MSRADLSVRYVYPKYSSSQVLSLVILYHKLWRVHPMGLCLRSEWSLAKSHHLLILAIRAWIAPDPRPAIDHLIRRSWMSPNLWPAINHLLACRHWVTTPCRSCIFNRARTAPDHWHRPAFDHLIACRHWVTTPCRFSIFNRAQIAPSHRPALGHLIAHWHRVTTPCHLCLLHWPYYCLQVNCFISHPIPIWDPVDCCISKRRVKMTLAAICLLLPRQAPALRHQMIWILWRVNKWNYGPTLQLQVWDRFYVSNQKWKPYQINLHSGSQPFHHKFARESPTTCLMCLAVARLIVEYTNHSSIDASWQVGEEECL